MLRDRLGQVRNILQKSGADAAIFFHIPTIRYLTGFTGSDGCLLVDKKRATFLTDSRYQVQAREELFDGLDVEIYTAKLSGVTSAIDRGDYASVAFESTHLTCDIYNSLLDSLSGVEFVAIKDDFNQLRRSKTEEEITLLRYAANLHVDAFEKILPLIRPGVSEQEIAWQLEKNMRESGGDERSFEYIVASGVRGAMPHGVATPKLIEANELVTIDFGIYYQGYASDETVTVAVGAPDAELRKIYDIVLAAHDSAISALAPGKSLKEIDAIARDMIEKAGYSDFFGHGLGHGVGLEVHEYPALNPRSERLLEEGMVVTIEPGIYLPGRGGVRLEDTVLITSSGFELITCISKEWNQLSV